MIDTKRQKQVTWINIPITKSASNLASIAIEIKQQQGKIGDAVVESPKKVRWSEELTQIKEISPRYKSTPWRFVSPNRVKSQSCQHFQCVSGKPCKIYSSQTSLNRPSQPQKQCQHFLCEAGRPCMMSQDNNIKTTIVSSKQLNCSPQLQKVVYRAVNNNNNEKDYWKPDRTNLTLNLTRATLV